MTREEMTLKKFKIETWWELEKVPTEKIENEIKQLKKRKTYTNDKEIDRILFYLEKEMKRRKNDTKSN